jgi:hypothetical protein
MVAMVWGTIDFVPLSYDGLNEGVVRLWEGLIRGKTGECHKRDTARELCIYEADSRDVKHLGFFLSRFLVFAVLVS